MLKIILGNEEIEIRIADNDYNPSLSMYIILLLQTNKVNGSAYHDDINAETVIKGHGANENIYYALTEIQDETTNAYFTIE